MTFHIITLFPDVFSSYLNESILLRAQKNKKIKFKFYNPRDFVKPTKTQKGKEKPYLRIDDKPYGGGPGMVMQALPIIKAIEAAMSKVKSDPARAARAGSSWRAHPGSSPKGKKSKVKIVFLSPSGKQFDTAYAKSIPKKYSNLIIICGHYEGIDARIKKVFKMEDVSIGPYVLTGGELPAMIMIDSLARQIEGVLGNFQSLEESRASSSDVYTRPEILKYKGKSHKVPKVLLSGDHKKIDDWRSMK